MRDTGRPVRGSNLIAGILLGLLAAGCQSLCYLFSRRYVVRAGHDSRQLFALSHAWMGLMALVLVPVFWSPAAPPWRSFVWPLLGTTVFYLLGQVGQGCLAVGRERLCASAGKVPDHCVVLRQRLQCSEHHPRVGTRRCLTSSNNLSQTRRETVPGCNGVAQGVVR